jgi:hypothetical protein
MISSREEQIRSLIYDEMSKYHKGGLGYVNQGDMSVEVTAVVEALLDYLGIEMTEPDTCHPVDFKRKGKKK